MISKTFVLGSLLGLLLPVACDSGSEDSGASDGVPAAYAGKTNPVEGDAAAIQAGKMRYTTLCASCHGDQGAGDGPSGKGSNPPPTNFQTHAHAQDDHWLWWISDGIPGTTMESYKASLTEAEIWELVAYIHTLE